MVWSNCAYYAIRWGYVCKDYIEQERSQKDNDITLYADFLFLIEEMYKMEMKKRKKTRAEITPSQKAIEEFLNDEKGNN